VSECCNFSVYCPVTCASESCHGFDIPCWARADHQNLNFVQSLNCYYSYEMTKITSRRHRLRVTPVADIPRSMLVHNFSTALSLLCYKNDQNWFQLTASFIYVIKEEVIMILCPVLNAYSFAWLNVFVCSVTYSEQLNLFLWCLV
jgi:hypothetical protein